MARGKVKLAFIESNSVRKTTFGKRKSGFLKKLNELSTLCDVDAFAVIYSPWHIFPEVSPSHEEAYRMMERFANADEIDQVAKRMVDMEGYLQQSIGRAAEKLRRLQLQNREKEMTRVMFEAMWLDDPRAALEGMGVVDLDDLGWVIDQYLVSVKRQLEKLAEKRVREEEEARPQGRQNHGFGAELGCYGHVV